MKTSQPSTLLAVDNFVDVLQLRAAQDSDDLAYTFLIDGEVEGEALTYAELDQKARAIAVMLQQKGMEGERALLLYPAGLDYISAFMGCLYAGVIAVPAYPPRRNRSLNRIEGIVQDASAKITLTKDSILQDIARRFAEDPALEDMVVVSTDDIDPESAEAYLKPDISSDTIAFLQYTSGSTGQPKGVMVSHGNLIHNEKQAQQAFGTSRESICVGWLPLYHDMGLIGNVLNPLFVGYPCYLMAPVSFLQKPVRWLQAISRYGATVTGGPNFAYDLCSRKVTPEQRDQLDLSTLEVAFNGAEPVRMSTLNRFSDTFGPVGFKKERFHPCYGLAEATLFVASNKPQADVTATCISANALEKNVMEPADASDDDAHWIIGCGNAWMEQQLYIVDPETGQQKPDNQVGEIWVTGASIARGYWNRPEETEKTFGVSIEGDPAMRTGDLGFLNEGQLYVTGRLKDLIIVRGRNHYPQDIEKTVQNSHPALEPDACAAFSLDIDGVEKLGIAIEIRRVNMRNLDVEEVVKAIRKAVSETHELQAHTILLLRPLSIPKTSSGKIQRHACKNGYLNNTLKVLGSSSIEAVDETEESAESFLDRAALANLPLKERSTLVSFFLQQLVAKSLKVPVSSVDPNQSLSYLGLDSLDTIELKLEIERHLKTSVPMDDALNDMSVADLAEKLSYQLSAVPEEAPRQSTLESDHRDLFEKCDLDGGYFGKYRLAKDTYFTQPVLEGVPGPRMRFQGREVICWSINNYLGLIGDPAIQQAAADTVRDYGIWTPMGSRMLTGNTHGHINLEQDLAHYLGKESSIVFNFGYMGVMGTIDSVTDGSDTIIIDSLSHACIVDGALVASSGKQFRVFRHNDMDSLEEQLKAANESRRGGILIVTEGVFGMTGDLGPLDQIVALKEKYGARLFVDDAHGFGVMGETGAGTGEYLGAQKGIDLYFGTFAKSFAAIGGVTAGDERVIDYIRYNARPHIFAKSLPAVYVNSVHAALDLVRNGHDRRAQMWHIAHRLQEGMVNLGFNIGSTKSPITPVYVPAADEETATAAMRMLRTDYGIFVSAVTYPVVPKGVVLFRLTSSAAHTDHDVDETLEAFAKMRDRLNLSSNGTGKVASVTGNLVDPTS